MEWRPDHRRPLWEPHLEGLSVELHADTGRVAVEALPAHGRSGEASLEGSRTFTVPFGPRWVRAELRGLAGGEEALIAFTNPVFL